MIIRKTLILECWCPHCFEGQMTNMLGDTFQNKNTISSLIGKKFVCPKCGNENTVEDVIEFIPQEFLVASSLNLSRHKTNKELGNWLNQEED